MIIKNFLTDQECSILLKEAIDSTSWQPQNKNTGIYILKSSNHKVVIGIHKRVSELFDSKLHTQMIRMIHKTNSNSVWARHSDNSGGYEIKYGVVLYLNDNFNGGELYYPNKGISIKPERGMLVFHAGDEEHEVLPVISGDRYTLTSFIRSI